MKAFLTVLFTGLFFLGCSQSSDNTMNDPGTKCMMLAMLQGEKQGVFDLDLKQYIDNKAYIQVHRKNDYTSNTYYYFSKDSGDSWNEYDGKSLPLQNLSANIVQGETVMAIEYTTGGLGWLVSQLNGKVAFIRKTIDSGNTWVFQMKVAQNTGYGNLKIINSNQVVVFVSPNSVFRTLDGGTNWTQSSLVYNSYIFQNMYIYDSGVGFVQGYKYSDHSGGSVLQKTNDFGVTWTTIKELPGSYNSFLQIDEATLLHTQGSNLYKTNDSATTWKSVDSGFAKYTYTGQIFPQLPCQL